jgi:hypothetical protein
LQGLLGIIEIMKIIEMGCFYPVRQIKTKASGCAILQTIVIYAFFMGLCLIGNAEWANPFEAEWDSRAPHQGEVYVGPTGISLPNGRILLARKDKEYCAIRFLSYWEKKNGKERYASYESFYQGDGTGDFSWKNVNHKKGEVSDFGPGMFLGLFHTWGGELHLRCGPMRLRWGGTSLATGLHFPPIDPVTKTYTIIEFAPTPWTDISQVNAVDPKIWWYQRDERRWHLYIPLDEFWNLPEKPEKLKFRPTQ